MNTLRTIPKRPAELTTRPAADVLTLRDLFHQYEKKRLRGASPGTVEHFYTAIDHFKTQLYREPTIEDLADDAVTDLMWWLVESKGVVAETSVSYVKKLLALWRFACRQGLVRVWPEVEFMKCPTRDPVAWSKDEMEVIFRALRSQEGMIGNTPACDFWPALLLTFWDTAERFTAVLSLRPEDVNLAAAWVTFRAETRKGKLRDRGMPLNPMTVDALRRILEGGARRSLVFEAPFAQDTLRNRYKAILRDAGLPYDSKRLLHCVRRTVASHFESAGQDSTELLDHAMRKTTTDSYLSPQIVKRARPADVLFRPEPENARELSEAEAQVRRFAEAQRFADLLKEHGDSLKAWIPVYLAECVEDAAPETKRQHRHTLARFMEFIGCEPRLEDLTTKRLLQFTLARLDAGVAETTADRERAQLAAIRRFVDGMRGEAAAVSGGAA